MLRYELHGGQEGYRVSEKKSPQVFLRSSDKESEGQARKQAPREEKKFSQVSGRDADKEDEASNRARASQRSPSLAEPPHRVRYSGGDSDSRQSDVPVNTESTSDSALSRRVWMVLG